MSSSRNAFFEDLIAVIASAVTAVGTVWGLSNSVLASIAPPVEDASSLANMVSFCAVGLLMALCLVIREGLKKLHQVVLAIVTFASILICLAVFLNYRGQLREYVYVDPPSAHPPLQKRYIRGFYHEKGQKIAAGLSTENAIVQAGGREAVEDHHLLWTNESKNVVTGRLENHYVILTTLLTITIFIAALTVWRSTITKKTTRSGTTNLSSS